LRDEVLPRSGFLAVSGWHGPEESGRWTRGTALAVFPNPGRSASLVIDCFLWRPGVAPDIKIALLVNGSVVGPPACSGASSEAFPLPEALLGRQSWGLLELRVDPVFIPRATGLSPDGRDLGTLVRGLRLEPAR
jgi:hypothetical protein